MREISRRKFASLLGLIVPGGIAGCAETINEGTGGMSGPQPTVMDAEAERGLTDRVTGTADINVLIYNEGGAGNVQVIVTLYDITNAVVKRYGDTVYVERGERRRLTFRVDVSGADSYKVEARAA